MDIVDFGTEPPKPTPDGRVVFRRWEGARQVDGNTIYFVFAEPAA